MAINFDDAQTVPQISSPLLIAPSLPIADTLEASKRFSFVELTDFSVALIFDDAAIKRPTAIKLIEFREPTGRDLFKVSNASGSNVDKSKFIVTELATRLVLFDGAEMVNGKDIMDAIENAPAWQATATMSIARFLDFGDGDGDGDE